MRNRKIQRLSRTVVTGAGPREREGAKNLAVDERRVDESTIIIIIIIAPFCHKASLVITVLILWFVEAQT